MYQARVHELLYTYQHTHSTVHEMHSFIIVSSLFRVELVLAVERLDEATDETHDLIKVAILERLSSTSSPTQEDTVNTGSKTQLTGNVVLIVCVLSVLVAVILLTLSGILLACVWIIRLNKERARKLPSTEKV